MTSASFGLLGVGPLGNDLFRVGLLRVGCLLFDLLSFGSLRLDVVGVGLLGALVFKMIVFLGLVYSR